MQRYLLNFDTEAELLKAKEHFHFENQTDSYLSLISECFEPTPYKEDKYITFKELFGLFFQYPTAKKIYMLLLWV
jgi:hypothetical protein